MPRHMLLRTSTRASFGDQALSVVRTVIMAVMDILAMLHIKNIIILILLHGIA